jgi:hypothetical protein
VGQLRVQARELVHAVRHGDVELAEEGDAGGVAGRATGVKGGFQLGFLVEEAAEAVEVGTADVAAGEGGGRVSSVSGMRGGIYV